MRDAWTPLQIIIIVRTYVADEFGGVAVVMEISSLSHLRRSETLSGITSIDTPMAPSPVPSGDELKCAGW